MYKKIRLLNFLLISGFVSLAQTAPDWPKQISSNGVIIKIYQPQVEYYKDNIVKTRGAFSIYQTETSDPVFGALWITATLITDRTSRTAVLDKIIVNEIKFAGDSNLTQVAKMKSILESEIPKWDMEISLDQLETSMEIDGKNKDNANSGLSTVPPKIIYANKPSTLVLIDGDAKVQENKEMGVDMVLNTAFTIAKVNDVFYLNGSGKWYSAKNINGPWTNIKSVPKALNKLDQAIKENDKKNDTGKDSSGTVPEIIVSNEPAELIQSNGEPDFATIKGTSLLYMTNTNNDIFMYTGDQNYYVLLSGRWYKSTSLKGPWAFIASDQLPADFAKIPVDSEKDDVLSSVAGTDQAQDAVMDAQIPQTAKVDRKTATTKVDYNGEPQFKPIDGTNLQYAVNTSSTVLLSEKTYYVVDNGIWYQGISPKGPWTVATTRPTEVSKIPATVPVYNVKYVYIYETTPQYVYVGYTPGYMGSYVYGPTVIYGTGFYYNPWYGPYYYPRPVTYGFGMQYNPWYGWGIGFHYSAGWFNFNYYHGGYYHGGYWGPPMYRPPYYHRPGYPPYYRPPYYPRPGYRPPVPTPYYRGGNYGRVNDNMYRNNKGVSTNDRYRPMPSTRPVTNPSVRPGIGTPTTLPVTRPGNGTGGPTTQPVTRPGNGTGVPTTRPSIQPTIQPSVRPATGNNNNVIADRQGNVFQRDNQGWQQRTNNGWQNVNQNRQSEINRLNQQQQARDRGNTRTNNFNRSTQPAQRQPAQGGTPSRGRR